MEFVKETSPHIRRKDNINRMLGDVVIALIPTLIMAFVAYWKDALFVSILSIVTMELCEFLFVLITKKDAKAFTVANFLAALVSALIYTLILPTGIIDFGLSAGALIKNIFGVVICAAAGITLGKLLFGGTGNNIFNPAAVGMVIYRLGWGMSYSTSFYVSDVVATGGTVLSNVKPSMYSWDLVLKLFLGQTPGAIGEGFKFTILLGMAYLLIRRAADWRVIASYAATFLVLALCGGIVAQAKGVANLGVYVLVQILSGGFLFGATFMITDPVTSPMGSPARVVYGMLAAAVAFLIRFLGSLPEGVGYGILIANCFSPMLDYYKWASPKFKKWHYIAMGGIAVAAIAFVFLGGFLREGVIA